MYTVLINHSKRKQDAIEQILLGLSGSAIYSFSLKVSTLAKLAQLPCHSSTSHCNYKILFVYNIIVSANLHDPCEFLQWMSTTWQIKAQQLFATRILVAFETVWKLSPQARSLFQRMRTKIRHSRLTISEKFCRSIPSTILILCRQTMQQIFFQHLLFICVLSYGCR